MRMAFFIEVSFSHNDKTTSYAGRYILHKIITCVKGNRSSNKAHHQFRANVLINALLFEKEHLRLKAQADRKCFTYYLPQTIPRNWYRFRAVSERTA